MEKDKIKEGHRILSRINFYEQILVDIMGDRPRLDYIYKALYPDGDVRKECEWLFNKFQKKVHSELRTLNKQLKEL